MEQSQCNMEHRWQCTAVTNLNSFSLFGILQLNDTVAPAVTLNSPVAHTAFSSNTINFNFTGTDNVDTTLNCTIFIDGGNE